MKKLLFALTLITSFSASAIAIDDDTYNYCVGFKRDALKCLVSTGISLPTILVGDQEIQLTQDQAVLMVISEMDSDDQAVTQALADANNMSIEEVQELAIQKYNQ